MIDDAGTLVDMVTRNTYDYVSEVLPLLNEQNNAINELINSEKYWEKKATQRINEITKENEQLKQYIYDNLDEDICDVCSYQYLEKSQMDKYYVAKCKKGYDNCSKRTVIHCKDFKFKELKMND